MTKRLDEDAFRFSETAYEVVQVDTALQMLMGRSAHIIRRSSDVPTFF